MHPPDKNRLFYGWVIVIAFFVICFVLYGVQFSFGVFFKSIESEFLISRATTSSILSVYMVLVGISAFIAGWAVDRFGSRYWIPDKIMPGWAISLCCKPSGCAVSGFVRVSGCFMPPTPFSS